MINNPLCVCVIADTSEKALRWAEDRGLRFDGYLLYIPTHEYLWVAGLDNVALVFLDMPNVYAAAHMIQSSILSQQKVKHDKPTA